MIALKRRRALDFSDDDYGFSSCTDIALAPIGGVCAQLRLCVGLSALEIVAAPDLGLRPRLVWNGPLALAKQYCCVRELKGIVIFSDFCEAGLPLFAMADTEAISIRVGSFNMVDHQVVSGPLVRLEMNS